MLHRDFRHWNSGFVIPTTDGGYADQPSLVALPDGRLLCAVTTCMGGEGDGGEYVSVLRSEDGGKSWQELSSPEVTDKDSSYGVLVIDREGCVYCIYNYNIEGYRPLESGVRRVDMGGHICMRYTTDGGESWSERREIEISTGEGERLYPCFTADGKPYRFFWNVARPFFDGDDLYLTMAKPYSSWMMMQEGRVFDESRSLLLVARGLVRDKNAPFVSLPRETKELLPPLGDCVAEEPCCVKLSDGTLFIISRTENGHPVCFLSRDGGETFSDGYVPTHMGDAPIKHPRAANFIWKLPNGRYLYWFHNVGKPNWGYRNPAWCCPCYEVDTPVGKTLAFGQPEILLFHESSQKLVSYPDLLYHEGHYLLTETEKQTARLHDLPREFMETIFSQDVICQPLVGIEKEKLLEKGLPCQVFATTEHAEREDWCAFTGKGCSFVFEGSFAKGETVFSARNRQTGGVTVTVAEDGTLRLLGASRNCSFLIESTIPVADGGHHHVAWVLDSSAHVSFLVIDGRFDNGTDKADCGWCFIPLQMNELGGEKAVTVGEGIARASLIERAILTTEAIGDYRASLTQHQQ